MKIQKGFTLIEVMVAVVIVAILASIAIPSYREYVIRGHRRAAQAAMMEIATRQNQYFVANRAYATAAELGYALPPEVSDYYDYAVTLDAGPPPAFTIDFTAKAGQVGDGDLSLTSEGVKSPAGKW
jgi:type IV pilus assembly protein PilE